MTYQEILDKITPDLDRLKQDFKTQLLEIRAGRLSPALIEDIKVDCFGSELPMKQLGAISVTGKEVVIQLWDKSYVEGAVKAIEKKKIGVGIKTDGSNIFLSAPPLTEESKKDLIKILNQEKEGICQEIRRLRDKAWQEMQDRQQSGELSEDDKYKGKDKLEDLIRDNRKELE